MAEPTGYAHAATLATGDPDLAVRLAGELREARDEIKRLKAERAGWWNAALAETPQGELVELRAAVERVRALHRPEGRYCLLCDADGGENGNNPDCTHHRRWCGTCMPEEDGRDSWPCTTIVALDPPDGTS